MIQNSPQKENKLHHAMEEEAFIHENGLITKAEVRAVSLAKLHLETDHTLWDLGSGSGSVSIEASLFIRQGSIFAVEKNPSRVEMIQQNIEKFAVSNLTVKCGEILKTLNSLPQPDRVFIGGGGKDLKQIIEASVASLKSDGRIVCNTVVIENMYTALTTMQELGLTPEIVQLQISRGHALPTGEILRPQVPIWIISATKL